MKSKKKILLTGATGFLGSHLLKFLISNNYEVVVLKRSTSDTWRIKNLLKEIEYIDVDERSISEAFLSRHIDTVIHTACHYGRGDSLASSVIKTNVVFSLQLLEAAVKYKASYFINTDSFSNSGTQVQGYLNYYNISKSHFIDWLTVFSDKIKIVNMNLQHLYGPKDGSDKFVPWLLSEMLSDAVSISLSEGTQKRDFIYVDDVVSAYLHLIENPNDKSFVEYDVGIGKLNTVKTFVNTMQSELEIQLNRKIKPKLGFGLLPLKAGEVNSPVVKPDALMTTGWRPVFDLTAGINKTVSDTLSSLPKNILSEKNYDAH